MRITKAAAGKKKLYANSYNIKEVSYHHLDCLADSIHAETLRLSLCLACSMQGTVRSPHKFHRATGEVRLLNNATNTHIKELVCYAK